MPPAKWRCGAERRGAQRRARESADRAVARAVAKTRLALASASRARSALEEAMAVRSGELERREEAMRPCLRDRVEGRQPDAETTIKRNVAWHSDELPDIDAPVRDWRRAQRGPRLDSRPPRPQANVA